MSPASTEGSEVQSTPAVASRQEQVEAVATATPPPAPPKGDAADEPPVEGTPTTDHRRDLAFLAADLGAFPREIGLAAMNCDGLADDEDRAAVVAELRAASEKARVYARKANRVAVNVRDTVPTDGLETLAVELGAVSHTLAACAADLDAGRDTRIVVQVIWTAKLAATAILAAALAAVAATLARL